MLGGQTLEQLVGVRGEADGERPDVEILPNAVEDDDAAGTSEGDEARQPVDERGRVLEVAGAENVEPVEEVEGWVRQRVAA